MPLKTSGIEEPSLNLTPMIDIVFLLIIFFMVGSQFTEPGPAARNRVAHGQRHSRPDDVARSRHR